MDTVKKKERCLHTKTYLTKGCVTCGPRGVISGLGKRMNESAQRSGQEGFWGASLGNVSLKGVGEEIHEYPPVQKCIKLYAQISALYVYNHSI